MKFKTIIYLIAILAMTNENKAQSGQQHTDLFYKVRLPKIKTDKPPLLLLLHGVGGNENNLFDLAESFPGKFLVISARGPLTFGPGSYAWFQVNFNSGKPIINEQQAEDARKHILKLLDDLHQDFDYDEKQVYLLGFSQGGIISYSVALTEPEKVKGIAVMSGRLLPEIKPMIASENRLEKLKVFVSHGKQDPVLQYDYAENAVTYLKNKTVQPDFHTYDEVHTINSQMLTDVVSWLNEN